MLSYGPWRPDVGGPNTGFATTADSVLPQAAAGGIGYGPFPQLVTPSVATALSGATRGNISLVKFDGNAAVLLNNKLEPIGTRIFGPVTRELRSERFMKIVSLAPEVL